MAAITIFPEILLWYYRATMTIRISETEAVKDFILISKQFCLLIDSRDTHTETEILQKAYRLLPQLCLCAMNLPEANRSSDYHGDFPHSNWAKIYESLQSKFQHSYDCYTDIDPYNKDAKSLLGSLSDDLSDIYRDISPGLNDWTKSSNSLKRGIIWEWKFSYEIHWGNHATSAFRAIHFLLFSQIEDSNGDYIGLRTNN
jgi:hypothetical protein